MKHAAALSPAVRLNVPSRRGYSPALRLMAHLRAPWIDRQLAAGVKPWHSSLHAARAIQLTSRRRRRGLARGLERILEDAEDSPTLRRGAAILPPRVVVSEVRPVLIMIAFKLRAPYPVDPGSVAALIRLMSDGAGPLYNSSCAREARRRLDAIAESLDVED